MRDYLEELLDLLTQEDEEEPLRAGGRRRPPSFWPRLWRRRHRKSAVWGRIGLRESRNAAPWMERGPRPNPPWTWKKQRMCLELDAALDQKAAIPDFPKETGRGACLRRGAACSWERGPAQAGAVLLEQVRSRRRPVLLQQAQELERQAGQAQALAQDRRSRSLAPALTRPSRGQASFPSQTAEGSGGGQSAGGAAWPGGEDQARLIDRAFQRDSRRYDRGFSLY